MLKKATIFDREYRVDQHRGDFTITQNFALPGFSRNVTRQNLRLERERIEQDAVATNLFDLLARKRHPHELFRSCRPDLNGSIANTKTSAPNITRVSFNISRPPQHGDQLFARQLLSGLEHTRSSVQPRPARQITTAQSCIDDL